MRLVSFRPDASDAGSAAPPRLGRLEGDTLVDLSESGLPPTLQALLEAGPEALTAAGRADGVRLSLSACRLEAPLARPPKILAVGLNYADHAAETGREMPKVPMIFNKQSTSVAGPYDPVHLPRVSHRLDYEGELGFVIGRRCRHVPKHRAHEVIAGYVVVNDFSVRDWQIRVPTFTMGKSFDTHCPFGPALVSADELGGDASSLELETWVNGERRQHSNTSQLIFDCFDLVEHLSTAFTLEPGDLISTGTPAGVASASKPAKWLVAGDVVRVRIEGLGEIENRVIDEPDTALI